MSHDHDELASEPVERRCGEPERVPCPPNREEEAEDPAEARRLAGEIHRLHPGLLGKLGEECAEELGQQEYVQQAVATIEQLNAALAGALDQIREARELLAPHVPAEKDGEAVPLPEMVRQAMGLCDWLHGRIAELEMIIDESNSVQQRDEARASCAKLARTLERVRREHAERAADGRERIRDLQKLLTAAAGERDGYRTECERLRRIVAGEIEREPDQAVALPCPEQMPAEHLYQCASYAVRQARELLELAGMQRQPAQPVAGQANPLSSMARGGL
ncbi:MAG: hypothetical protein FJ125_11755 [Deltaproteobacteria bacterium]|nr:hypothetical protein [Deltaproteobacteria bacterium]